MTDSSNNSFEQQWQHAFDDAELTPPESVWEKIELTLKPENTPPAKPNFGSKSYYFWGGVGVGLLGLFLWINNLENKSQTIEKEEVIIKKLVNIPTNEDVKNEMLTPKKQGIPLRKSINSNTLVKVVDVVGLSVPVNTNYGSEETPIVEPKENNEEISPRTLTDSVEMIEPLTIKNIQSEIEHPVIILPTEQTPYYIKPIPKSKKKSILKNVKISVGAGLY
jgi:hypothetical protein